MSRLHTLQNPLRDATWRYALLAGLVSASYTAIQYWQSSSDLLRFQPVFFAGLLGGFFVHNRVENSRRLGRRIGLVGAIPVLWTLFDTLVAISGFAQPAWVGVVQVVLVFVVVGLIVVLSALSGMMGAMLGGWLAERTKPRRPFVATD